MLAFILVMVVLALVGLALMWGWGREEFESLKQIVSDDRLGSPPTEPTDR